MQSKHAISGRARGRFPLAPEGRPFIITIAAALLLCVAFGWWAAALIVAILLAFNLNFFRDPDRNTPNDSCAFIAPADGRVIRSESIDGVWRVDIFMNVFNVHVNRAPMAGRIMHMHYFPGVFVNASFDKASKHNERNRFTLLSDCGASITFTQIAGLIARRIVSYVAVGDHVEAGQRIGMIRFGSRVDCRIPEGFDACVAVGDTVVAGESLLARRTENA
ncbi:MAG: phosphatidylserine decarboxylase family protein [Mariprofundaceae bacterium]